MGRWAELQVEGILKRSTCRLVLEACPLESSLPCLHSEVRGWVSMGSLPRLIHCGPVMNSRGPVEH